MQKTLALSAALALGLALTGCGNTLSGAKQDAATDTQKSQQAAADATQAAKAEAQKAGQATKDAAQKVGAAVATAPADAEANTVVRPAVKTAIIRDVILNNPSNLIDVNAGAHGITLTGHVADASMKQRATEDANAVLQKHPGYTLTNDLTVAGQ